MGVFGLPHTRSLMLLSKIARATVRQQVSPGRDLTEGSFTTFFRGAVLRFAKPGRTLAFWQRFRASFSLERGEILKVEISDGH